jgi:hypothetical protein
MASAASAVLVFVLAWSPSTTQPIELTSVRRLSSDIARHRASGDAKEQAADSANFARLVDAVLGQGRPGVTGRDAMAYKLLALGYSATETADIVSGRTTKQAVDTTQAMRLVGRGRELREVAVSAAPTPVVASAPQVASPSISIRTVLTSLPAQLEPVEAAILKYARLHAVDPALIRAIIGAESAFSPGARSTAGAIGLMQLMPATAQALGVDPRLPEQNIEGGVRYMAGLLRMFGRVELALVAYNAGPEVARRYARGETTLYGETRRYVQQVMARMRAPR